MTTMMDEHLARLRTHRNNITRYRRLLRSKLSDPECDFIERRMSEEQSSFEKLVASTFPMTLQYPTPRTSDNTHHGT